MYSLILHGAKRSIDLQKCNNLRVSLKRVQNVISIFSNTFSSVSADVMSPRDCLKGLNPKVSNLVDLMSKCNPNSVLNLFRSYDFTDSQISSIILADPRLLIQDAENYLGPKLKLLKSKDPFTYRLTEIVSRFPKILRMKENKAIGRYYALLKTIGYLSVKSDFYKICACNPDIEKTIRKVIEMGFYPGAAGASKFADATMVVYRLSNKTIKERVNVYISLGFDEREVWEMFKMCPSFLCISKKTITQSFETLKKCGLVEEEVLSMLKKSPQCIGISELKITQSFETLKMCGLVEDEVLSMFKKSPRCIGFSKQNILNSIKTFLGLGFSRDEVMMMVKSFPPCLNLSGESIKKKTHFLVKKMNWPRKGVVSIPVVLGCSMEKRIVPRCNVIKALMSKRLLKTKSSPMSSVLICTDDVFLERYVMKHDDQQLVDELIAIFDKDQ